MPALCVKDGLVKERSCELQVSEQIEVYVDVEYLISKVLPSLKGLVENCIHSIGECKAWSGRINSYISKTPKHVDSAILSTQGELILIELSEDTDIEKLAKELLEKLQCTFFVLTDLNLIPKVNKVTYTVVVGDKITADEVQKRLSEAINNTYPLVIRRNLGFVFQMGNLQLTIKAEPCVGK
ncbi:hypothetical protein [Acidianus sp. HS-5]|uniref:hypothetical protein n=1 Tax=Acidianus sp. HS-5 TaxID=2886040 RepID=UPI001F20668B|nr:hypothetical protein [Acidianus sp. HS-5]BDC18751.1 hypothetical protein HS5_16410 [Acidianus sp. HS-5]